jgi:hypothetical protein
MKLTAQELILVSGALGWEAVRVRRELEDMYMGAGKDHGGSSWAEQTQDYIDRLLVISQKVSEQLRLEIAKSLEKDKKEQVKKSLKKIQKSKEQGLY